jgi:hypothetical protein
MGHSHAQAIGSLNNGNFGSCPDGLPVLAVRFRGPQIIDVEAIKEFVQRELSKTFQNVVARV